jgi:hypothetical protein
MDLTANVYNSTPKTPDRRTRTYQARKKRFVIDSFFSKKDAASGEHWRWRGSVPSGARARAL